MKLHEIYNTPTHDWDEDDDQTSTTLNKNVKSAIYRRRAHQNHTFLGIGAHAYVGTDDDENFGDVHRISPSGESGSEYLNFIASHPELHENPFFPKVRQVKNTKYTQIAVVERLIPFDTPAICNNAELMTAVFKRYFNGQFRVTSGNTILRFCEKACYNNCEDVKDAQLVEAITTILALMKQLGVYTDFHEGNLMWRPHPYQPQLVFTDPLQ